MPSLQKVSDSKYGCLICCILTQNTKYTNEISTKQSLQLKLSVFGMRHLCAFLVLSSCLSLVYGCGPSRGLGAPRRSRKLTPLVFEEFVPAMSETRLGASGPMEGKLQQSSAKFKDLVPNYNELIIFEDKEGTGADRLMSKVSKSKDA